MAFQDWLEKRPEVAAWWRRLPAKDLITILQEASLGTLTLPGQGPRVVAELLEEAARRLTPGGPPADLVEGQRVWVLATVEQVSTPLADDLDPPVAHPGVPIVRIRFDHPDVGETQFVVADNPSVETIMPNIRLAEPAS